MQTELEIATRDLRVARDVAQQFECPAVPEHHAAGAVVAGWDIALEIAIVDWMIFHVRGEMLHAGVERWPLGNGPGLQNAVDFQPEIVVQARSVVSLHAEIIACKLRRLLGRRRLGRVREGTLGDVLFERHRFIYSVV